MQAETVKTLSSKMPNGDLILAVTGKAPYRAFFVKTTDGVFEYSENDIIEIYHFIPHNVNLIGEEV